MPPEPHPQKPHRATLVLLAWNRWDLTRRCLESLRRTSLDRAEIVVVDNGSTDETPERLGEQDDIRVVTLPRNLGYVRGNNAGIAAAPSDADVVLLNNDLLFEQADWLERLRDCAHSTPEVGIVGCRLLLPDGRLAHAGTYVLPDTLLGQQIGGLEKDVSQYTDRREVEGIIFACAYLRREFLDALGGLPEEYESYFEDTDLCLSAWERGFRVMLCGDVSLVHDEHGSTQQLPGTREEVFQHSRRVFDRRWRKKLEARYRHGLAWQSVMNLPSGYSVSTRALLETLDEAGVRMAYQYVYGPGTPYPLPEPEPMLSHRLNTIRWRSLPQRPPVSVVFGQGDVFRRNIGRYKIGFTMLEVDGFPADWVRQANGMDEVWVPNELNRQGFLDGGLRRPIYKIPLGVDTHYFHPGGVAHRNPHGEMVLLTILEWGERKAPGLLLQTFNEVFSAREPVRLVCKIISRDREISLPDEIRRLELSSAGGRISYLFNLDFPHYQLPALYRSVDCFVSTSRGEGWGMPLLEAMACGLPAIATNWGAHQEFFHEGVGYPLRIRGTVPAVARCPYYEGFRWADPDPEHLRHLLRWVYEHREEGAARGAAAAREVATHWTWESAAQAIVERLAVFRG
ncbi:MAG TPA: glycosyltransferase [Thermoanaerobaculia bacterium]|nr:glycosyltransferase [Thermoanaerobaculia bacterium]